jgi:hypothetical protein
MGKKRVANEPEQFVQTGAVADRYIVNFADRIRLGGSRSQDVRLDCVLYVTKVAARLAVTENVDRPPFDSGGHPFGPAGSCRFPKTLK